MRSAFTVAKVAKKCDAVSRRSGLPGGGLASDRDRHADRGRDDGPAALEMLLTVAIPSELRLYVSRMGDLGRLSPSLSLSRQSAIDFDSAAGSCHPACVAMA